MKRFLVTLMASQILGSIVSMPVEAVKDIERSMPRQPRAGIYKSGNALCLASTAVSKAL